jgi:uncharacterized membrane protein
MKNSLKVATTVVLFLFLAAGTVNIALAQSEQKAKEQSNPIPSDVMKIIEKSCLNCHSEPGKTLALSHVNLSKWDQYSPEKQADKAKAMCKEVSKEKMPPKKFRGDHPEAVPTSDEVKTICDWAQSFQQVKK